MSHVVLNAPIGTSFIQTKEAKDLLETEKEGSFDLPSGIAFSVLQKGFRMLPLEMGPDSRATCFVEKGRLSSPDCTQAQAYVKVEWSEAWRRMAPALPPFPDGAPVTLHGQIIHEGATRRVVIRLVEAAVAA